MHTVNRYKKNTTIPSIGTQNTQLQRRKGRKIYRCTVSWHVTYTGIPLVGANEGQDETEVQRCMQPSLGGRFSNVLA